MLGRDALHEVQQRLRTVPGVTVIIYDQRCAAQARRLRKRGDLAEPPRRVIINEAVCEGCGDCGVKSNCLSVLPVVTEFGEKREVHDPSCNRDYSCLEGDCPSFVTISPRPAARGGSRARHPSSARPDSLAAPAGRPPGRARPAGALPAPVTPQTEHGREARRQSVYFSASVCGTRPVTAEPPAAAPPDGERRGCVLDDSPPVARVYQRVD